MEYNTHLRKLALPEYGRNIHNMVDFCTGLEDRDERTRCAYTIIEIMGDLFPHLRDVNDFKHILWDHLAIMSGFGLDIDYPYPVISKDDLQSRPDPVEYSRPTMRYRHYGKNLERMIEIAVAMEDGEEQKQFIVLIATHMKKSYMQWNKEVDDTKIFTDLYELSQGKIDIRGSQIRLPEMKEMNQRTNNSNNNTGNTGRKKRR